MSDQTLRDKQITKLLQEYEKATAQLRAGSSVELEIRIKDDIDKETYESIIRTAKSSSDFEQPTLEMSVNIISMKVHGAKDTSQSIQKITYVKDVPNQTYLKKTRLVHPIMLPGYLKHSVGLSIEEPVQKFLSSNDASVRFKLRMSFVIKEAEGPPQWRLDITAVKMGALQELSKQLKQIRTEIFNPKITPDNILDELNHEMLSGYEVEIEYIGGPKPPADLRIIDKVFTLVNRDYNDVIKYQDEIYFVASYIAAESKKELFRRPTHRLKQLSNQVVSLSMNTYYNDIYPPTGYYATDKADGQRAIISMHDGGVSIIFSDGMKYIPIAQTSPGGSSNGSNGSNNSNSNSKDKIIIVDAEYITGDAGDIANALKDKKNGTKAPEVVGSKQSDGTLYIFDCMVCGENISSRGFEYRVEKLQEAADALKGRLGGINVQTKRYVKLGTTPQELEAQIMSVMDSAPYNIDGLILTAPGQPYHSTANYKWKPYENNTIDFLAIKCPRNLLGIRPYDNKRNEGLELYILFVGIDHTQREKLGIGFIAHYRSMFPESGTNYYPIQFSPSAYPLAYLYYHPANEDLDRKIIELGRDRANTSWIFHRVRTDRTLERNYYGNDYRIAELTFSNYIDPFELSSLWNPSSSYFTKTADNIYVAANKFKRFVISLLLKENISGSKWVIDAAAGRGADLHRYQEIGVEHALFIDVDSTAITELIRRKYSFMQAKKRHVRSWMGSEDTQMKVVTHRNATTDVEYDKLLVKDVKSLTVHTLVADLKTPVDELIAKTMPFGINTHSTDGIVCNFAIHYLCDTTANITNFMQFVSRMLKTDGVFIFTTMSGEKVFEALEGINTNQTLDMNEGEIVKYALRKEYDGKKLLNTGQMIAVKLPFSDEMYSEPLCNIDYVIGLGKKFGLELEQNSLMTTYMEKFKKADRGLYDRLTETDHKYIALHSFVTLRKVK
jgi:SAM-dependent methyltransferase